MNALIAKPSSSLILLLVMLCSLPAYAAKVEIRGLKGKYLASAKIAGSDGTALTLLRRALKIRNRDPKRIEPIKLQWNAEDHVVTGIGGLEAIVIESGKVSDGWRFGVIRPGHPIEYPDVTADRVNVADNDTVVWQYVRASLEENGTWSFKPAPLLP